MDDGSGSGLFLNSSFSRSPFTHSTPTSTPTEDDENLNLLHNWLVPGIIGICAIIAILILTLVILCCCCCYICRIHNMKNKGSGKIVKFADSEEEKVELSSIKALEKEGSGRVDKSGDLLANDRDNKEKEVTSEPRNDKKEISFSSFGHKNINTDSTDQDEPEGKTVTIDVEPPQDLPNTCTSEAVSKQESPENKDTDKLGPKNTRDVDKGTASNTKANHESKQEAEPSTLLQTQNQDASERSDKGYKETPIAVAPPKPPLLLESSELSIPHDVKNGSTTCTTSIRETESYSSQPADGDDKLTAAELLSFADIEKSLGIALEGLDQ